MDGWMAGASWTYKRIVIMRNQVGYQLEDIKGATMDVT